MKKIALMGVAIAIIFGSFLITYGIDNQKVIYLDNIGYETKALDNLNNDNNIIEEESTNDVIILEIELDYDQHNKNVLQNIEASINPIEVKEDMTNREVNEIRGYTREAIRQYHLEENRVLDELLAIEGYVDKYISHYMPYIEYIFEVEVFEQCEQKLLSKLSNTAFVKTAYVRHTNEVNVEAAVARAAYGMGVGEIFESRELSGRGVTVGVLEVGIADKEHASLVGTNIIAHKQFLHKNSISEHTTTVAAIIAGHGGMAPDATILTSYLYGSPSNEIDWLLNKGADIINLSCENRNPDGYYSDLSAYMDYIVYTYRVTIVAAVGNESGNISALALGYNVISVGAYNDEETDYASFSNYQYNKGAPEKPTILARGTTVYADGFTENYYGTSFSCAITSGSIALLMEQRPYLKCYPQLVTAILCANAQQLGNFGAPQTFKPLAPRYGAGKLHLGNAIRNIYIGYMGYCTANPSDDSEVTVMEHYIDLKKGQTLRASLAWLAKATGKKEKTVTGDYDLRLFLPDGQIILSSQCSDSNVELFSYLVEETATYVIRITIFSDRACEEGDFLALAYAVF
ncbi:MAG: S8 family peptidase [Prevotella sp.]|nr:S8 family peptidase [Staphylococcus sp.]MCM1350622.1 S8 family peptidase [Prevotella sp.]